MDLLVSLPKQIITKILKAGTEKRILLTPLTPAKKKNLFPLNARTFSVNIEIILKTVTKIQLSIRRVTSKKINLRSKNKKVMTQNRVPCKISYLVL